MWWCAVHNVTTQHVLTIFNNSSICSLFVLYSILFTQLVTSGKEEVYFEVYDLSDKEKTNINENVWSMLDDIFALFLGKHFQV